MMAMNLMNLMNLTNLTNLTITPADCWKRFPTSTLDTVSLRTSGCRRRTKRTEMRDVRDEGKVANMKPI